MPMWTKDQEQAIFEPSGNGSILVSAAAGSGKTAVLVERIAQMILREENPVSIDNLLVVTFTEAAAAEMKERIIARINDAQREALKLGDTDKAKYLREQIHLTSTADINTIDAFCLGVVRNNFHILGIDPNFGIMDAGESDMLMDDALEELFNELYSTEDSTVKERFEGLIRLYASNRDDDGLMRVVRKIYNFTQSFADPIKWLHEKAAMYTDDMTESEWMREFVLKDLRDYIVGQTKDKFEELREEMLGMLSDISEGDGYWGSLWEKVNNCCAAAKRLSEAQTWEDYCAFYEDCLKSDTYLGSGRNRYTKKTGADEDTWNVYFNRCHSLRGFFRDECRQLPRLPKTEFNEYVHAREIKRIINDLVWLVELFDERYEEKKAQRNIKTFSDIEHLAYRLFEGNENIRGEYAEKYEEILIDEFQDTNGLQDSIFTLISRDSKNMFMVGDLKQSIYRFRGGDPMIFKNKSRRYTLGEGGKLIMLSQNFRSRMQVIDGINAIFSAMMSDEVGDVNYMGGEILSRDADKDPYTDGGGYKAELCRIAVISDEAEDGEDISAAKAEAMQIAKKIRELTDGHYKVYDHGICRDIEYRDIVILMKSTKSDGAIFRDALERYGIRAFVQKEEYFERREIKLMLSLISLINNHLQDIPLTAVMRSPIGGFTDNELAMIRIANKAHPFYNAVKYYKAPENPTEEETRLERKCSRFVINLDKWRGYVKRKSIAALIWTLYEETGFYDFMGALEGGEEAQANLKLLYERAKRYEASGFRGIFNFIRYIERMERRREDIAGAQLVNANHNVVRIMTIHKSKGLEFPVVFLARTTKKIMYTFPGDENRIVLHNDLGIGADYYNYEDLYYKKLLFADYIRKMNRREHMSEEMRLLYVAATRARERLIVTASYGFKTREKYEEQYSEWELLKTNPPWDLAKRARSIADWIIPVAQDDKENWICDDLCVSSLDLETDEKDRDEIAVDNMGELRDTVKKILEYGYKYPRSGAIPAKTSVTAIKEMADEENIRAELGDSEPVYMASKPAFLRSENLGARIGTAHHQVMAYINLGKMKTLDESEYEDFVAEETARIANEGQIEKEIAEDKEITDMICKNVCGFFKSDMGKAVLDAKRVHREKPFEIEISAREYDGSLDEAYEGDSVVVQGIIDLFFEDKNGDIILVDYKTDRCKTIDEQRAVGEKYRRQIELYERAMEKILKRNVKEKYLYLFSAQSMLKLK